MTVRYDEPNLAARAGNEVIRWLAEAGVSIAGTRALRVRGRKTGKLRGVVINLLSVDGRDYVVSPRGNTQWARNARAADQSATSRSGDSTMRGRRLLAAQFLGRYGSSE